MGRRRTREELEAEADAQAQAVAQAQTALAAAARPAAAARTRLVLLRAWQQVLRATTEHLGTEQPCESMEVAQVENSASAPAGEAALVGPVGTDVYLFGGHVQEEPEVVARAARFLRDACRRARRGGVGVVGGTVGGAVDGNEAGGRRSGDGSDDGGCGGDCGGARNGHDDTQQGAQGVQDDAVLVQLLRSSAVERALDSNIPTRGSDSASENVGISTAAAAAEKCLLCRADMAGPEGGMYHRLNTGSVSNGQASGKQAAIRVAAPAGGQDGRCGKAAGLEGLELPGWAVCRRGHRLTRCADTLVPTLSVDFRRCEVCWSVIEVLRNSVGGKRGSGNGVAAYNWDTVLRGMVARERGVCVLCDVLVTTRGFAL